MKIQNFFDQKSRTILAALSFGCLSSIGSLQATVQFTGVAAGDATSIDAIVWTRALDPSTPGAAVTAQHSTDPLFGKFVSNP
jgi:phosphodiesterase/alkaline phosphatase D-like protein